ncbi:ribonuclease H-like domain-containing protein [Tanacetum coccineum]
MDLEQNNSLAKLPLLKQEEGNSFKPVAQTTREADGTSTTTIPGAITIEEKILKKNGLKARSILMMTLPSEIITPEELNLKFLRSLPTEWGHSSRNDDNIANVHVSTGSSPVSTASTNNSTACLSDATVYAYLATQLNGSQVVHEDLEQIHEDDLDEMDLKWQLALLSMKARKFYQITGKKIVINGRDTAGYDKKKVECFNCHKLGHFARECRNPKSQENRSRSQDSSRRTVNVKEASPKALLSNRWLQGFEGSKYDKLRIELNKSESDLDSYKKGLASVEEQLVFYKKNESMLCDQIVVLKRDASFNESDINALKKQVERLKKEKEDNQFKIDNFENASKSLDQLIGNQISDNNKKGLGYNVVPPPLTGLFAPPSIDLSNSGLEKFKQPEFEGYGVKVNKGASENVSKEVKKTSDAPIIEDWVSDCDEDETVVLESLNVQKSKQADQPRKVCQNPRNNSTSWNTPMPKKLGVGFQFTPKACFVCGSFNHLIKDCDFHDKRMIQKSVLNNVKEGTGQREIRPVWTNAMRVNHQKFSNSRRNFAPTSVLTKSGLVPFSTARQSFSRTTAPVSAARSFKTVAPKLSVNIGKQKTNSFQKSHSPLR